jgi:tetratricopeptide (TPR) repeat protein
MQHKTLLEVMTAPAQEDYVHHFQALAQVNLEIRQSGPTAKLLLHKSILEVDLGNYSAALVAVRDALDLKPDLAEASYQEGMSLVLLAFTKAGVLAGAPGMAMPGARARRLLEKALEAFKAAVEANPDDEEASADIDAIQGFLALNDDDSELDERLRAMLK